MGTAAMGPLRLDVAEQAWEAADLAGLVLLAALDDEIVGVLARDDLLRIVGAGTKDSDSVVVRENHILDGLVGHFANPMNDVGCHCRRRLSVGHQNSVADDDAGVRVTFCGVRPRVDVRYVRLRCTDSWRHR